MKRRMRHRERRVRSLLARDGDRCCYCQVQFDDEHPLTVEHIIPRSVGGVSALHNLRLACWDCNHARGMGSRRFQITPKEAS